LWRRGEIRPRFEQRDTKLIPETKNHARAGFGAYRAADGLPVDRDALCKAAITVMDNPPEDEDLKVIADYLVQAVLD
jgi:hypothetical protein